MKLKKLRLSKELSQKEIADILQITQSTYSYYEKDKTEPNITTLKKLADYYNVSLDYLCDRQWHNDLGYITPEQIETIEKIKLLSPMNFLRANSYIDGLLIAQ